MLLRRVQQLDPDNDQASELLNRCAQRLAAAAIEAHSFGLFADADQYLALALSIQPGNPKWRTLQQQWQRVNGVYNSQTESYILPRSRYWHLEAKVWL